MERNELPEGWKRVKLGEIAENNKFSIVDGPFGTQLHADEYTEDGEIPVIRIINLSFDGRFINKDIVYISTEKARKLKRSKVMPGDIIIAKTGATIGKSAILPSNFIEGIIASSCMKVSIDKSKADNKFILFWIISTHGQNEIINSALGTTRTTINISPFKNISFPLPPLPEQQKIAEILETVDRAIEKTEKIIEKYKRIKQGLMQDLLTKGVVIEGESWRLRNEKTDKFKDSPIGRIPEEWEVVNTLVLCESITDGTHDTPKPTDSGIPLITSKNIKDNKFDLKETYNISEKDAKIINKRSYVSNNTLLFSMIGTVGSMVAIEKKEFDFCVKNVGIFRLKKEENLKWFYYSLSFYFPLNMNYFMDGSTQNFISLGNLKKILLPRPPLPEQQKIAEILSQIDEVINKEEKYKEKLEHIKIGLMEDLLTGKVRVNNLIEEVSIS